MFKTLPGSARMVAPHLLGCMLFVGSLPAAAQAGCTVTSLTDPPREILRCRGILTIEAEQAARYRLVADPQSGLPKAADVDARAVLIEIQPGRRGGFQVLTPHAIASVRGTIYAVDVQNGRTSVFVVRGRVAVAQRDASRPVLLKAGEGVDVVPGRALEVTAWARERAAGLLARFGR